MKKALLAFAIVAMIAGRASASLVFDDFNVDEGHFGYAPNFSSTTVGEGPTTSTSTADRVLTGSADGPSLEGAGHQKLVLVHSVAPETDATTPFRVRHLSGGGTGPAWNYNSANAGTSVGNTNFSFTTGLVWTAGLGFM